MENLTSKGPYYLICCNTLNELKRNPLEDEDSFTGVCAICGTHWWAETVTIETPIIEAEFVKETNL